MLGVVEESGGWSGGKRLSTQKCHTGCETRGNVGGSGLRRALQTTAFVLSETEAISGL